MVPEAGSRGATEGAIMETLQAYLSEHSATALTIGGLIIGMIFGAIVQRTNFCTMGSLSDMLNFGDSRRFRAWLLATGTAIAGTQALRLLFGLDVSKAMYLTTTFDWFGAILGGLLFGFGMVFAGGCASRNLVRAGTGDLRSLVVVMVIGISAYAAIGGLLGPARAALTSATAVDLAASGLPSQSLGALLGRVGGLPAGTAEMIVTLVLVAVLAAVTLGNRDFRASPPHLLGGLGIGLCVVVGWALTSLAYDEMAASAQAPISLSFVRPSGDGLEWIQRYTALGWPNFGVASLFGTMIGAFLVGAATGRLKLATFFDAQDTVRNLFGAVLMGIGGVLALGCTVGQAITGAATLAAGSFVAFAALVAGGLIGLKTLERL
jgi:uncharacterized membrane protein YedE/YeeE